MARPERGEATCSFAQVVPPILHPYERRGGGGYASRFTALQQLIQAPEGA